LGGALVRLGHFLARVKTWGRSNPKGPKYGLSKNALWVGTIQHRDLHGHWTKLHRTSFAKRMRNCGKLYKNQIFKTFICFGDIRRRTLKSFEIVPNFACFSPPKIFGFAPKNFLDRHYKIGFSTDHRAKFRADRPTHLGDLASGEKKHLG